MIPNISRLGIKPIISNKINIPIIKTILDKKNKITCINKEDRLNPWEKIKMVGGVNSQGKSWKRTQEEIINYINSGTYYFYVNTGGKIVSIIVTESRFGNEYIKTENDGDEPNNLLSLPECNRKILLPLKNNEPIIVKPLFRK